MGVGVRHTIAVVIGQNKTEYLSELVDGLRINAMESDANIVFISEAKIPKYCGDILTEEFGLLNDYHFHSIHEYIKYIKPDVIILAYGSMTGFRYVRSKAEYRKLFGEIPTLMIEDTPLEDGLPYLISDNYGGMREVMEHLVGHHGYSKILFMAGPRNNYDSNERLRAYRDVMAENNLTVTPNMIEHGDYSIEVEDHINALLDGMPDAEAIVCANDTMAQCAYTVCESRGLYPGDKIAITGFDNLEKCQRMSPALTSVVHSGFVYSYNAIKEAINICEGRPTSSKKIAATVNIRGSCGCNVIDRFSMDGEMQIDTVRNYTVDRLHDITTDVYKNIPYKKKQTELYYLLQEMVDYIVYNIFSTVEKRVSTNILSRYVRQIYTFQYVSGTHVLERIALLLGEIANGLKTHDDSIRLLGVITYIREYISAASVNMEKSRSDEAEKQAWFLSAFTRDIITDRLPFERNMRCIFKRFRDVGIPSAYMFFFQKIYKYSQDKKLPRNIYLAGFYDEDAMEIYPYANGRKIGADKYFTDVMPRDRARCYYAYVVFAGERHFGMLLSENTQEQYEFMLACSLQLGSMFHLLSLQDERDEVQKELNDSMRQLRSQNKVLNFVSKQDELTGLLNRRGMMEEIMASMTAHHGERATLFFADLDHLKEINDCFGHSAGDLAIDMAAEFLRLNMPRGSIIGRIGGDEFVVFTTYSDPEQIRDKLRENIAYYNEHSGNPYYVEMSVGYSEFVCYDSVDVEEEISKSDKLLYIEKKKRRKSIKK